MTVHVRLSANKSHMHVVGMTFRVANYRVIGLFAVGILDNRFESFFAVAVFEGMLIE